MGEWDYFGPFYLPGVMSGYTWGGRLVATLSGTGDADLYVRKGALPTDSQWDCRPYIGGSSERCDMTTSSASPLYVGVKGFNRTAGVYHLVTEYTNLGPPLPAYKTLNTTTNVDFTNTDWTDLAGAAAEFGIQQTKNVTYTIQFKTLFSGTPSCMGLEIRMKMESGQTVSVYNDSTGCGSGGTTYTRNVTLSRPSGYHAVAFQARVHHNNGPPTIPFPVKVNYIQISD
ncbi:MAG: PPC domain-containing protein [Deltaproteobacteria bacterium]|nr:PPC domain-containing protein [Deltaproteobacteria bacterium]